MNLKLTSILVAIWIAFVVTQSCPAGEPKKDYPPNAAQTTLDAAARQATDGAKKIFMKSGFPECGWCRVFDRYHEYPETKAILEKYYVIIAIDTSYMPDGKDVYSKYARPGAPSWVILTGDKQVVVDSFAKEGNVGYPLRDNELAHYVAALKKATPVITEEELKTLSKLIHKAAGK